MDYTKVPRSLIYQDFGDIDFFPIDDDYSIEGKFYNYLFEHPFIKDIENQAEIVLDIFNNAYYICTLIYNEYHPRMYLNAYKNIASNMQKEELWLNYIMPVTMELVYGLIKHDCVPVQEDKFFEDIKSLILKASENTPNEDFGKFIDQIDSFDNYKYKLNKERISLFIPRDTSKLIRNKYIDDLAIAEGIDYLVTDIMQTYDGEWLNEELDCILVRLEKAQHSSIVEEAICYINKIKEEEGLVPSKGTIQETEIEPQENRLTASQAALFCHALADKMGFSYRNKKEEIAPMVNKLFGYGIASIKNKLCGGYSQKDRDYIASIFDDLYPDFSDFVKSFGNRQAVNESSVANDSTE
ncbi:MAG: hypothetical protein J5965_15545 [Aeriscardovia sp.]|nr:hypothetical protein [Aeriscardovia sp.]MBP3787845.1 hypothetical protein [Prevotella sp.]